MKAKRLIDWGLMDDKCTLV